MDSIQVKQENSQQQIIQKPKQNIEYPQIIQNNDLYLSQEEKPVSQMDVYLQQKYRYSMKYDENGEILDQILNGRTIRQFVDEEIRGIYKNPEQEPSLYEKTLHRYKIQKIIQGKIDKEKQKDIVKILKPSKNFLNPKNNNNKSNLFSKLNSKKILNAYSEIKKQDLNNDNEKSDKFSNISPISHKNSSQISNSSPKKIHNKDRKDSLEMLEFEIAYKLMNPPETDSEEEREIQKFQKSLQEMQKQRNALLGINIYSNKNSPKNSQKNQETLQESVQKNQQQNLDTSLYDKAVKLVGNKESVEKSMQQKLKKQKYFTQKLQNKTDTDIQESDLISNKSQIPNNEFSNINENQNMNQNTNQKQNQNTCIDTNQKSNQNSEINTNQNTNMNTNQNTQTNTNQNTQTNVNTNLKFKTTYQELEEQFEIEMQNQTLEDQAQGPQTQNFIQNQNKGQILMIQQGRQKSLSFDKIEESQKNNIKAAKTVSPASNLQQIQSKKSNLVNNKTFRKTSTKKLRFHDSPSESPNQVSSPNLQVQKEQNQIINKLKQENDDLSEYNFNFLKNSQMILEDIETIQHLEYVNASVKPENQKKISNSNKELDPEQSSEMKPFIDQVDSEFLEEDSDISQNEQVQGKIKNEDENQNETNQKSFHEKILYMQSEVHPINLTQQTSSNFSNNTSVKSKQKDENKKMQSGPRYVYDLNYIKKSKNSKTSSQFSHLNNNNNIYNIQNDIENPKNNNSKNNNTDNSKNYIKNESALEDFMDLKMNQIISECKDQIYKDSKNSKLSKYSKKSSLKSHVSSLGKPGQQLNQNQNQKNKQQQQVQESDLNSELRDQIELQDEIVQKEKELDKMIEKGQNFKQSIKNSINQNNQQIQNPQEIANQIVQELIKIFSSNNFFTPQFSNIQTNQGHNLNLNVNPNQNMINNQKNVTNSSLETLSNKQNDTFGFTPTFKSKLQPKIFRSIQSSSPDFNSNYQNNSNNNNNIPSISKHQTFKNHLNDKSEISSQNSQQLQSQTNNNNNNNNNNKNSQETKQQFSKQLTFNANPMNTQHFSFINSNSKNKNNNNNSSSNYQSSPKNIDYNNNNNNNISNISNFHENFFLKKNNSQQQQVLQQVSQLKSQKTANFNKQNSGLSALELQNQVLLALEENQINKAFEISLSQDDDIYLIRLMTLTGPCYNKLTRDTTINLNKRLNGIMMSNFTKQIGTNLFYQAQQMGLHQQCTREENLKQLNTLYQLSNTTNQQIGASATQLYKNLNNYLS